MIPSGPDPTGGGIKVTWTAWVQLRGYVSVMCRRVEAFIRRCANCSACRLSARAVIRLSHVVHGVCYDINEETITLPANVCRGLETNE